MNIVHRRSTDHTECRVAWNFLQQNVTKATDAAQGGILSLSDQYGVNMKL